MGGGTKTSGGVTANINVDYNWRPNTHEIKVNRVYGNWIPSSNTYTVSNRKVNAHNGGVGKSLKELSAIPLYNSFSYGTSNWGYNQVVTGDHGARAWSSATVKAYGMSGTSHTITVNVWVPN